MAIFLGPKIVPWLLTLVARTGSRELFTLTVLAIALGIAFGSAADLRRLVRARRLLRRRGHERIQPQPSGRCRFAAACRMPFRCYSSFPSACCLIPRSLVRQPMAVIGALALIIVGKSDHLLPSSWSCFAIRSEWRLTVSGGLAQIGEFSFILASLGVSLGLLPNEGQDIILAVRDHLDHAQSARLRRRRSAAHPCARQMAGPQQPLRPPPARGARPRT